jgi:hypothetical protein
MRRGRAERGVHDAFHQTCPTWLIASQSPFEAKDLRLYVAASRAELRALGAVHPRPWIKPRDAPVGDRRALVSIASQLPEYSNILVAVIE